MKEEAPVSIGASPLGIGVGGRSTLRAGDPRLLTLVMMVMPVSTVIPVRVRVPVPNRGPVPGGIVVRLTIPVNIAVKSHPQPDAWTTFDTVGAPGFGSGRTGVRGHRSDAQDYRAEQGETAVRIVVVLQRLFVMAPGTVSGCRRGDAIGAMYRRYVARGLAWYCRYRTGIVRVIGPSIPMSIGNQAPYVQIESKLHRSDGTI